MLRLKRLKKQRDLLKYMSANKVDFGLFQEYCLGPCKAGYKNKKDYRIYIGGTNSAIEVPAIFVHKRWQRHTLSFESFEKDQLNLKIGKTATLSTNLPEGPFES